MTAYFADTSYWVALVAMDDPLHTVAYEYASILASRPQDGIVTTQLVLNEVLNPRSGTGPQQRLTTVKLVDEISQNPGIDIVTQTPEQFADALGPVDTMENIALHCQPAIDGCCYGMMRRLPGWHRQTLQTY